MLLFIKTAFLLLHFQIKTARLSVLLNKIKNTKTIVNISVFFLLKKKNNQEVKQIKIRMPWVTKTLQVM